MPAIPANLAPIFQQAGAQYHIPPNVLAGIAQIESSMFQNMGPSSAGAIGGMQFEPATARSLGVNPNDPRSAIFGAAKLLNQYGYQSNPFRAIGAYNGGPGNPQSGYARQVLAAAQQFGGGGGGAGSSGTLPDVQASLNASNDALNASNATAGSAQAFDQAAYRHDMGLYMLGKMQRDSPFGGGSSNPLLSSGVLPSKAPDEANYYVAAQSNLQAIAGDTVLNAHPVVQQATGHVSNIAGGFLPAGASYQQGRRDQGRDGQTQPGGPVVAPGNGYVVRVGSDPNGFGPRYPIVHFTTGPYAGRTMYIGHTLAAITSGSFKEGQTLSYTGTTGIGNATVPGWFEIGFADSGSPGPMGQPVPF